MDLAQLIQHYGYAAVAVGTFLEGEAVLVMAAVSAHLGYLHLPTVVAVAAIGAFVGDNVYFFAGRTWGPALMRRSPALAKAVPRVDRFVGRWHALAVIALRFTYGLRIAGPVVLGAGRMKSAVFLWANGVGALLWAGLLGALGWGMGRAATGLLGGIARVEHIAIGVAVVIVAIVMLVHFVTRRRLERSDAATGD